MFTEQELKRIRKMGRKNRTRLEAQCDLDCKAAGLLLAVIAASVILILLF